MTWSPSIQLQNESLGCLHGGRSRSGASLVRGKSVMPTIVDRYPPVGLVAVALAVVAGPIAGAGAGKVAGGSIVPM